MVTVAQVISELLNPLLGLLGVVLRGLGALGVGIVAGSVLRNAILYKVKARFYVPLIFLGTVGLFAAATYGSWSSPGTVAMAGIGIFVGFRMMRTPPPPANASADGSTSEESA